MCVFVNSFRLMPRLDAGFFLWLIDSRVWGLLPFEYLSQYGFSSPPHFSLDCVFYFDILIKGIGEKMRNLYNSQIVYDSDRGYMVLQTNTPQTVDEKIEALEKRVDVLVRQMATMMAERAGE